MMPRDDDGRKMKTTWGGGEGFAQWSLIAHERERARERVQDNDAERCEIESGEWEVLVAKLISAHDVVGVSAVLQLIGQRLRRGMLICSFPSQPLTPCSLLLLPFSPNYITECLLFAKDESQDRVHARKALGPSPEGRAAEADAMNIDCRTSTSSPSRT